MSVLCQTYSRTIGKKIAMALSGLVLVGFVVGHMAGNLKVFLGADAGGVYKIDHYGEALRTFAADFLGHSGFLWMVRVVLLAAVAIHVWSAISLSRTNYNAKPKGGAPIKYRSANAASRTMFFGGLFILCFIVFHILHLTTGTTHWAGFEHGKVYHNLWTAFHNPILVGFYVISMAFLALHLFHGVWSMFQTLGIDSPMWNGPIRFMAKAISIACFIGFSAVPISIALDLIPPPHDSASHTHT